MFNASDAMLKIGVPALRIIGIHYSDRMVLHHCRYRIPGTWQSSIQYDRIHHASAGCADPVSLYLV